ncbi:MAG: CDP-alcohol phosphatidyltransferase family protein [Candidatus Anstonellaceae archaeon]
MLKNKFSFFSEKIADIFIKIDIEPNLLTLSSIPFSIISAYLTYTKNNLAILFVLFTFFLDAIDGAIARKKNKITKYGAYLDGMCDRVAEFFILLPFLLFEKTALPALIILFFGSFMHAFSKAYCDHRKLMSSQKASKLSTIFGRVERGILLIFIISLYVLNIEVYILLLWIGAILSFIAFLNLQLKIAKYGKI